jgi:hypothetical protein
MAAKVHLPRPDYPEATLCGQGGVTFTGTVTEDPVKATCKICLKARRLLDRERDTLKKYGHLDLRR